MTICVLLVTFIILFIDISIGSSCKRKCNRHFSNYIDFERIDSLEIGRGKMISFLRSQIKRLINQTQSKVTVVFPVSFDRCFPIHISSLDTRSFFIGEVCNGVASTFMCDSLPLLKCI